MGRERTEAKLSVRHLQASKLVDPVDGDDALRQRRLALPSADDEVGPAGDRTSTALERRERLVDGSGRDEHSRQRGSSADAAHTRSGVMGSARTRAPTTPAIAFAIAPGVGTVGGSPTPFEPFGPPFSAGVSIQSTSIRGASEAVTSL